jgi:hypothetical protein
MRVGSIDRLRGETVQQIHGGVEPLSPIAPGEVKPELAMCEWHC